MDAYYGLTRHADTFVAGSMSFEAPTWALWAPLALIAMLAAGGRRIGLSPEGASRWRSDVVVLVPLAAGALGVPVLISTAGAFATQAFLIVHVAAAAFLVDGLVGAIRRPSSVRRSAGRTRTARAPADTD